MNLIIQTFQSQAPGSQRVEVVERKGIGHPDTICDVTRLLAIAVARRETPMPVEAAVNAADDLDNGSVFLTVIGTSAEAGDDGELAGGTEFPDSSHPIA